MSHQDYGLDTRGLNKIGSAAVFAGDHNGNRWFPVSHVSPMPILAAGAAADAFQRLRTSDPVTVFDSQTQYDKDLLQWFETVVAGGSINHLPDESSVRMRVGAGDTDSAIRQTKRYMRYQPGKSQLILMTFALGAGREGSYQLVGYGDDNDGIFLKESAGALSIVRRTSTSGSPVDEEIAQADWNLDPMTDVTGHAGTILDPTKTQILVIDLQWLGVGRVRVGFDIDGEIEYVHEFLNANVRDTVYIKTANLPLRYEIANTTAQSGNLDLKAICSAVISEGGFEEDRGNPFSASNGTSGISVSTRRPVLSIRPKTTFNSITGRGTIVPVDFGVLSLAQELFVEIVYGGALTGATFNSVDDDSLAEFDVAATDITGGIVISSFFVPTGGQNTPASIAKEVAIRYPLVNDISGLNPIPLSIVATALTGSATVHSSVRWSEFR